MVAKKAKTVGAPKGISKKGASTKKLRIGILVGKDFDPVKKGSQWPDFPPKLCLTKDDWGKYSVDACTAVKMQQLHPDLLDIDIIPGKEVTQKRLAKNHVNLNFWYDLGVAIMNEGSKAHIEEVKKCHYNPDCRLDPSGDYYDWILNKTLYMEQLIKAGIPMIPTVFYKNGFDGKKMLKDVEKKGWDKFFCKVGQFSFFGAGAVNGKLEDFKPGGRKEHELVKYAEDNKDAKIFLLQPYMLKPNGEVFDEVRNFFIDGEWRYSVFTHGTDGSDAGYYQEPDGPRKVACKAMAIKAYNETLKACKFQGTRVTPLLNRIDIGVIPKKGADSLHKTDNQYFVNEIEMICTTWLDRYSPISVQDVMAHAAVKHSMELAVALLNSKKKMPDRADVKKVVGHLNKRLGPFKNLKIKS
jgi:hypothetical protein